MQTENLLRDAGMTVLIGLVVVFAVLIILTFIFWLFGKVVGSGKSEEPAAKPAPSPAAAPRAAAPIVEDGVPDEVVAAIAAAVSAMSTGTTRYAVRRISASRPQGARSVWAAAGLSENTQPF